MVSRSLPAFVLAIALAGAGPAGALTVYRVTDLGGLGGGSGAIALSGTGAAVGYSFVSGTNFVHAMENEFGHVRDLGTLGGTQSLARGVNRVGSIVGWSYPAGSTRQYAFLWRGGVMTSLGTLGGDGSDARAVNDAGVVVGSAYDATGAEHAVWWKDGEIHDLGTLGGPRSRAFDINQQGVIVGMASPLEDGVFHAFFTKPGEPLYDLGTLGGPTSHAYAINEQGDICGWSMLFPNSPQSRGFLWTTAEGTMRDLHTLGGEYSAAFGLNNLGQVVGATTLANDFQVAFIYDRIDGQMRDLNSLLPPNTGWRLTRAWDIDDHGAIVGEGTLMGVPRAFLLTPESTSDAPRGGDPGALAFAGSVPNPVAHESRFEFTLPRAGAVRLDLYDVRGRRLRQFVAPRLDAGSGSFRWDGREESGQPVANGVYWAKLRFDDVDLVRRVVVAR